MSGKTVLITGASRGIGAAAARAFADAGANVALVARSTGDIAEIAGEIGEKAIAIPCDVSRYAEMQTAVAKTVETFGQLDVLINNAGVVAPIGHLQDTDPEAWAKTIDINVKGVYNPIRAAAAQMKAQGGAILLVSVELEEVLSLSDRILVMSNGEQTGMVDRADADEKSLGLMMAGIEGDAA